MSQMNKNAGPAPTIEPASLAATIKRATAAIEPGRRGKLLIQWDGKAAQAALMLRGLDGRVEVVGRLIKLQDSGLGWELATGINFLMPHRGERPSLVEAMIALGWDGGWRLWIGEPVEVGEL